MDGDEQTSCSICLTPLISEPVSALRCGHVFHQECIAKWISAADCKAKCALCNKATHSHHVRNLEFLLVPVPARSPEEIARWENATDEEREKELSSLCSEQEADEAAEQEAHAELAKLQAYVQSCKESRHAMELDGCDDEEMSTVLQEEGAQVSEKCINLRVSIDKQIDSLKRAFPVTKPREADQDLREERRKMRIILPKLRAAQLHEALVATIAQEAESDIAARERKAAAEDIENRLSKAKKHELQYRCDLRDMRDEAELRSLEEKVAPAIPSEADHQYAEPAPSERVGRTHFAEEVRLSDADPSVLDANSGSFSKQKRPASTLQGSVAKPARQEAVKVEHVNKLKGLDSNMEDTGTMLFMGATKKAAPKGLLSRRRA